MDEWSAKDTALLVAALTALGADIHSTKGFIARGGVETNPILGESPSNAALNRYGAGAAALGTLGALAAPSKYRKALLGAWAGFEAGAAYQNKKKSGGGGFLNNMKKPAIAGLAAGLLAHHFLNDEESGVSVGPGALGPMSIKVQKKF